MGDQPEHRIEVHLDAVLGLVSHQMTVSSSVRMATPLATT